MSVISRAFCVQPFSDGMVCTGCWCESFQVVRDVALSLTRFKRPSSSMRLTQIELGVRCFRSAFSLSSDQVHPFGMALNVLVTASLNSS